MCCLYATGEVRCRSVLIRVVAVHWRARGLIPSVHEQLISILEMDQLKVEVTGIIAIARKSASVHTVESQPVWCMETRAEGRSMDLILSGVHGWGDVPITLTLWRRKMCCPANQDTRWAGAHSK